MKALPFHWLVSTPAHWFRWIESIASWKLLVLLLIGALLCIRGFEWRLKQMNNVATPDGQIHQLNIDTYFKVFTDMGPDGRSLYVTTQLTLDVAFPLIYTHLLATAFVLSFSGVAWLSADFFKLLLQSLVFVQLLTGCADLIENITGAWLANHYQLGVKPSLGYLALYAGKFKYWTVVTSAKIAAFALAVKLVWTVLQCLKSKSPL